MAEQKDSKAAKTEKKTKSAKAPTKAAQAKAARAAKPATPGKQCREQGCKRPYRAKGYCVTHYKLWRQGKHGKKQRYKTCGKEGCNKPMGGRWGLCDAHAKGGTEEAAAPAASG